MDRELLIQIAAAAMDNVHDMDTNTNDFAAAAVDALGWRTLDRDLPEPGDLIVLTDGEARWMEKFYPDSEMSWRRWTDTKPHIATHWHPLHELPEVPNAGR